MKNATKCLNLNYFGCGINADEKSYSFDQEEVKPIHSDDIDPCFDRTNDEDKSFIKWLDKIPAFYI